MNESEASRRERRSRVSSVFRRIFFGLTLLFIVGVAALMAWGGVRGWQKFRNRPELALHHIDVKIRNPARQALFNEASFAQASGLTLGTPLFDLDLRSIKEKLESLSWVRQAGVRRDFPDRVVLEIDLYEPVAILSLDKLYYVDVNGRIFKEVNQQDGKDYPLITGMEQKTFSEQPQVSLQGIVKALEFLDYLGTQTGLQQSLEIGKKEISELHLEHRGNGLWDLSIVLTGQAMEIRLGFADAQGYVERLERLSVLKKQLGKQLAQAAVLDLRLKDRVVVTPKTVKNSAFFTNRGIEIL